VVADGVRRGGGVLTGHDQVPSEPVDGERFVCSHCGVAFEYVDLNDGQPGEWVSTEGE